MHKERSAADEDENMAKISQLRMHWVLGQPPALHPMCTMQPCTSSIISYFNNFIFSYYGAYPNGESTVVQP